MNSTPRSALKTKLPAAMALGACMAFTCPALAEITVMPIEAKKSDPWDGGFAGGQLSNDLYSEFQTSGSIGVKIQPNECLVQTFKGDGKVLRGVGLYFEQTAAPTDGQQYTLKIIDLGTSGPYVEPKSMDWGDAVFTDSFVLSDDPRKLQCYFDLSKTNLKLEESRYYGLVIEFSSASRPVIVNRSLENIYADGRLAIGEQGKLNGRFAEGDRDANFALYTAP